MRVYKTKLKAWWITQLFTIPRKHVFHSCHAPLWKYPSTTLHTKRNVIHLLLGLRYRLDVWSPWTINVKQSARLCAVCVCVCVCVCMRPRVLEDYIPEESSWTSMTVWDGDTVFPYRQSCLSDVLKKPRVGKRLGLQPDCCVCCVGARRETNVPFSHYQAKPNLAWLRNYSCLVAWTMLERTMWNA